MNPTESFALFPEGALDGISAITYDLHGVLIRMPSRAEREAACAAAFATHFPDPIAAAAWYRTHFWTLPLVPGCPLEDQVATAVAELGRVGRLSVPEIAWDLSCHWESMMCRDGGVIAAAQAVSLPRAVVTDYNHPTHLWRMLRNLDLQGFAEVVEISGACGHAKPNPALFWRATRRLGVMPDRCLHVGDQPCDVEGARAAGFRGVGILDAETRAVTWTRFDRA